AGVPCSPVQTLQDVVEDPHSAAREMFVKRQHREAGDVVAIGAPVKFSETPGAVGHAAPVLGEHTCDTLASLLGYDQAMLDRLVRDRVIVQADSPSATANRSR